MTIYEYLLECDKEEFVSTLTEMMLAVTFSNFYNLMSMLGVVKGDDEEQFMNTVIKVQERLDNDLSLKKPIREMVEIMLSHDVEDEGGQA